MSEVIQRIPFSPEELKVIDEYDNFIPNAPKKKALNTPITPKENMELFIKGEKPLWMPSFYEIKMFDPRVLPDNVARALVADGEGPCRPDSVFQKDIFGVEWEFIPKANGSMVRPGAPFLEDINDWEKKIVFPDLSKLDWEGSVEKNKEYLNDRRAVYMAVFTGIFERLISFVDMTEALLALIDDEQKDAVHGLFDRLADFYDELFSYLAKYFHPTYLWFHDDWGSQKAPLFSLATVREMILPYLRRIVDSAHKYGMGFELHSCGKNEMLVPAMIEAGCDMWAGQPMNDKEKLYKEYGKDIKLGIEAPSIAPDATDAEIREVSKRFFDIYPENTYIYMTHDYDPRLYPVMYEESRKRYCG